MFKNILKRTVRFLAMIILVPIFFVQEMLLLLPSMFRYYLKRTLCICTYVYSLYLAITLFVIPAFSVYFAAYGVWSTFGLIILVNVMSFASSFGYFFSRRPTSTQATPKGATPC